MHSTSLEIAAARRIWLYFLKKRSYAALQSAILLPVAILKFSTSYLYAILIMRGAVLCDVTERQTGAVKMPTAEKIKLLVTSKNLAMLSYRNLTALEELLSIETGLTVCSHVKLAKLIMIV